ncbi:hypothetical protein DFP72DRAFT_1079297 [Ephemerocybe angulata]|uniref:Uncharacterized protein n=1 Tax=Ephemerocybe angulata TaxID=980116 RepID=A0A8H6HBM7_9AGAR|nr:hypothetical protein DFP72DRAFT_1079297 [Tulosesus angulatus]
MRSKRARDPISPPLERQAKRGKNYASDNDNDKEKDNNDRPATPRNAEDILAASDLAVAPPARAKQRAPAKPKVQATAAALVVTRKHRSEVDEVREEALSEVDEVKVRELSEEEVASGFELEEIEEPKEKQKGKVTKKVFVEDEDAMEVDVNNDQPPSPQPAHGASSAVGGVFRGNRERFNLADAKDMMEDPPVLPINRVVFVHVSKESAAKYDLTVEKHDAKISVQVRHGMTEVLKRASRKWPLLAEGTSARGLPMLLYVWENGDWTSLGPYATAAEDNETIKWEHAEDGDMPGNENGNFRTPLKRPQEEVRTFINVYLY